MSRTRQKVDINGVRGSSAAPARAEGQRSHPTNFAPFWERSEDLFAAFDSEGRFVNVNPSWLRVLGWTPDQMLGHPVTVFTHPADLEPAAEEGESRWLCADGSYRWLMWSSFSDGEGRCGIGRDVTERNRTEAARDLAQREAAEAYERTGLSVWRWDPVSDYVSLSGELESAREAMGVPSTFEGVLEQIQPSHRTELREAVTRLVEGVDDRYCVRFPAEVAEQSVVWLESRGVAIRDANGNLEAVHGTTQDVTEAEVTRLELLRTRDFSQATLDSLDAHIAVLDQEGTIVAVNWAWHRFASENGSSGLGVDENYLEACDGAPAHAAPEAGPVARALQRILAGSLDWYEIEYPCHSPDEERWFSMRAVPHRAGGSARVVVQHHNITQRVQAERSERLRSRLLDEVDAAVVATDLDGRITVWSHGAQALYGWTEEEAVGERMMDLAVPAHFHRRGEDFLRHLNQHSRWQGDLKLKRKDGSRFTGFVRCSISCNEDGVPLGLIGISVDATERVRAEEDLRKARDYLAAVTDSMGEGLVAVDSSGAVVYMNAEAEKVLGWSADSLLGRRLHETIQYRRPDGSPSPAADCPVLATRVAGETVRVEDDVFSRRDGSPVSVSYTTAPCELPDGGTGSVMVFADTSERKQAASALQASEAQLKAIVDNTSAAIYVKRKGDYQYLLANPEFESIFGLEPGTAVGKTDEELLPEEVVQQFRETDRGVIEEGVEATLEEEIPVGGTARTYLTLKFPLRDEHGEPYALCGISTDITERRLREAELSERLEWEGRILTAVNEDRLLVYAQPIVDLRSGAVVQEELLVRMRGGRGSNDIIPPGEFLPPAERFGLIGHIDRFMVHQGIALAASGRPVHINLSGHSISDRELTQEIERELRASGADPSKIVFEITETAAVEDMQAAREFSERIARLGCECPG